MRPSSYPGLRSPFAFIDFQQAGTVPRSDVPIVYRGFIVFFCCCRLYFLIINTLLLQCSINRIFICIIPCVCTCMHAYVWACMCVFACMWAHMYMCVSMWRGQKLTSDVLLNHSPPCIMRQDLSLERKPHQFADLVSHLVLALPSLSLPSMGTTGGPPRLPSLHVGAKDLHSTPYACTADSTPTGLSPWLQMLLFVQYLFQ